MRKVFRILWKVVKWVLLSVIFLLILIAIIVKVPAVHDFLLQKGTTYFNEKTGGNLSIAEIDLRIPGYVQLNGISLKTPDDEKLASIGNIEISVGWRYLFDKTIRIDKLVLEDVDAQLLNRDGSGWNYDFIAEGFSDSTATPQPVDTTASAWDFSLGYARLSDINFTYYDFTTQDSIAANLSDLTVAMNRVSVMNSAYIAEKISLSNSDAFVRIGVREDTPEEPVESNQSSDQMVLDVHEVLLENNTINFQMGAAPDKYFFDIGHLNLLVDKLDINDQIYRIDKLDFNNSNIEMALAPSPPDTLNKPIDPFAPIDLKLNELNIDQVGFKMETYGEPESTLELDKIHIELVDLLADSSEYSGELKSLRGVYNALDRLQEFQTGFLFTRKRIALNSLFLQYGSSEINADIKVNYENLTDLIESGKFENASLKIVDTFLKPYDLKHIGNELGVADSVLILPDNTIFIDAIADGNLNKINLDKFLVQIGNTNLSLNAEADGVDWDTKDYVVNDLKLHLERSDIMNYITAFEIDTAMIPEVSDLDLEGTFETLNTELTAELRSTYGNISISGNGGGYKSKSMPIHAKVNSQNLDIGGFLGLSVPFITDFKLTADAENALDSNIYAHATIRIDTLIYDAYNVRNIDLDATLDSNLYVYQLAVRDTFFALDMGGSGAMYPGLSITTSADLQGIDLQGLGITKEDMRGQLKLKGEYSQTEKVQSGNATISNAIFVRDGERFEIEPIDAEIYLSEDSSMTKVTSQFFDLYSITNRSIEDLTAALVNLLGRGEKTLKDTTAYWHATFESRDTPLLRDLFIPDLKSFEPATATIDFEASSATINADINFPKIKYRSYSVDSLRFTASGNNKNISTDLTIQHVGMDTLCLDEVHLMTTTTKEGAKIELLLNEDTSKPDSTKADYYIRLDLIADSVSLRKGFSLSIADSLILNKKVWEVDPNNDIYSSKEGTKITKLRIFRNESELEMNKDEAENSTHLSASNFGLATLSGMINTENEILTGRLFGDFTLNSNGTFSGNGRIEKLTVAQADFGLFKWEADKVDKSFNIDISSNGEALEMSAKGSLTPESDNESAVDLVFNLVRFDLAALAKLAPSFVYAGGGTLSGKIDIDGSTAKPELQGNLEFNKGKIGLVANGSTYSIDNQKIDIKTDEIAFNTFAIADSAGQKLVIDGNITHQNFNNLRADLSITADHFEIADLKAEANQGYYGKLLADLDIDISGRLVAPKIKANIDIADETALTYVVPESEYSDSYDENMIIWTDFDGAKEEDILTRTKNKKIQKRDVYANTIDLNGEIDIDKDAIFRVLIDSLAGDYLQIQGGGKLGVTYDRTGNLNLNGTYKVQDGFYQMTFYNIVKKKFNFQGGSQLTWNGDPLNAILDITALYTTRANVAALMSTQPGASSNSTFSQKLPFEVVMNITGELMKPELKFSIRLAKESKGALGGAVDARLNEIAANESELNKQVFALLVLNTFISTGGTGGDQNLVENQVRNSASQILSQQLNALSDRLINGVDLNFDLQSYDGGGGQASTDLNIDLAKSFMNDRIIIRVGSTIALEDNNQNAQNSQEMMTNLSLEYKITPEGTYRLKAFRTTDLEDIVVGKITRTGVGILYQKDFNRLRNIFKIQSDLGNEGKSGDDADDDEPNPEDGK
ncbi:hypothetical protein G3O08_16620 [Cryomorpha ignava]|uniref:Translocation and assembly module TamB C-terminal domain-containing protein n=1 Tax=Cryomorpha ignava TaxID=101383 RepID=A0A7K3WUF4_9FLAO|nr:translocation/assembly module TamB domain-containing protein [Cryomorpha ignava]NEN25126.1 hypothetical protein [Cryomorpha ignava]